MNNSLNSSSPSRRSVSLDFVRTTEVYFCHECRRMHSVNLTPDYCCVVCKSPCVELIESDEQYRLLLPIHTRTLRVSAEAATSTTSQTPPHLSPLTPTSPSRPHLPPLASTPRIPSSSSHMNNNHTSPSSSINPAPSEHAPRPYAFVPGTGGSFRATQFPMPNRTSTANGTDTATNVRSTTNTPATTVAPTSEPPRTFVPTTTVIIRTTNSDGTESEATAVASGSHSATLRRAVMATLRSEASAHAPHIVVESSTRSARDTNTIVAPPASPPAPVLRTHLGARRPRQSPLADDHPPHFDSRPSAASTAPRFQRAEDSASNNISSNHPASDNRANNARPPFPRSGFVRLTIDPITGSVTQADDMPNIFASLFGNTPSDGTPSTSAQNTPPFPGAGGDNTRQSALPVGNLILSLLGSQLMFGGGGAGGPGAAGGSDDLQSLLHRLFMSHDGVTDPTPQSVIDALPTVSLVTPQLRSEHPHLNNPCAVCQESLVPGDRPTSAASSPVSRGPPSVDGSSEAQSSEVIILPCEHCYHKTCLVPWLERSQKCPVCRRNVSGETHEGDEDATTSTA